MVRVQAVAPGSLGAALGLVPGTELHAVNGRALEDFLDWEFLSADEQFVLSATLPGGDAVEYDVERPEGLPAGVGLVPGARAGAGLVRTLTELFELGESILSVSVVPVALTEYSKRGLVRELAPEECRAALTLVGRFATRALAERGFPWCYGADDLYLQAGEPLPPAEWYGDFEQRENGVGAVRYLQTQIAAARDRLPDLAGTASGVEPGA